MATPAQLTDQNFADPKGLEAPPPGVIAPKTPGDPDKQQDQGYGPNNEYLESGRKGQDGQQDLEGKPKVVAALRQMVLDFRTEGIVGRRHEIRRIKQARLFWQGLQYNYGWDADYMDYRMPFGSGGAGSGLSIDDDKDVQSGGRYTFVTNWFQGYGLTFISLMSQDVPTVNWFPQSAQIEQDIVAAKAAGEASRLIQENNHPQDILRDIAFHLWTDGKLGGYVRYVADGQQFGFHDSPVMQSVPQKMGEDAYSCPQCGTDTPPQGLFPGNICPNCGTQLSQDNFKPAPVANVPQITAMQKVPNGQEVISIIGGLELNTPVWAGKTHEMPYIQWQLEVHKAKLKASYAHVADKIMSGNPNDADDVYARASRVAVKQGLPTTHPGDALYSLITFTRNWIRPWAFYSIDDADVRKDLLALFPDGCYAAFAGDTYCESRNENVDDHWRVLHAIPGDGQNRPAVGSSMISPQEQYNIMSNMAQELAEFGIPPVYADPEVLDFDALANQTAEPAAHYPANAKAGRALADSFFQPMAASMPPDQIQRMTDLGGAISQFLTGLPPAVFGGEMEDVKTATGYGMARDQAMGRIGLIWRGIKEFYSDVMMLAVDTFRKNRPEDAEIPILGDDGEYEAKVIRLADLKGNIQARPEADETFPRLKSQQRSALQQVFAMAGGDPAIGAMVTEPANLGYIKNVLGLVDFVIPGEDSRNKQLKEIGMLLQGQPSMVPGQPTPDGQPGQPRLVSTIQVNPMDRHEIEAQECVRWASSGPGLQAAETNPGGRANVQAHWQEHMEAIAANQQPQTKPPSESMNFKDMPPDGQMQMAKQAGIDLNPVLLIAQKAQEEQANKDKADAMRKNPPGGDK